jgi:hypothetical protein
VPPFGSARKIENLNNFLVARCVCTSARWPVASNRIAHQIFDVSILAGLVGRDPNSPYELILLLGSLGAAARRARAFLSLVKVLFLFCF